MNDRNITTTITYNKNCNYNQSIQKKIINVPLVPPNLNITIEKEYYNDVYHDNKMHYYYDDTFIIHANVSDDNGDIKWGSVLFYFIDQNDPNQEEELINKNPISVTVEGRASIQYIPHNSGIIRAKYSGEPYYAETSFDFPFELEPRPVTIKFKDFSPYLTDPKSTVEMSVVVMDDNIPNKTIDYGLVTFLNYHSYDMNDPNSKEERVIGNPKFLINGEATINYSPIQLDDSNELLHNIELIRASYNYNNTEYGLNWNYYAEHNDWTSIAIRRPNQVNMCVPMVRGNDGQTFKPLEVTEEELFVATQKDTLVLLCDIAITDEPNVEVKNADVSFVLKGTKKEYDENGTVIESPEEIVLTATSYRYWESYEKKLYEYVITSNDAIPIGLYKVYAQVDNVVSQSGQIVPINNITNAQVVPQYTNNGAPIYDGIYLKSNISESFYIQIDPGEAQFELELKVKDSKETIITNEKRIHKDDILLTITGPNKEPITDTVDIEGLLTQKCYFYVPELNKTIEGSISADNNALVGKINKSFSFGKKGNFSIYAYIKAYTHRYVFKFLGHTQNRIRRYPITYSNSVPIKIRDKPEITLRFNKSTSIYPGDIKYIIEWSNYNNQDVIQVQIKIDENKYIYIHDLSNIHYIIENLIPPLSVGEHIITATIITQGYENVTPITKTIEIEKAKMNIDLNNYNILSASPADLYFNITNEQENYNLGEINKDDFQIEVMHVSSGNIQNINTNTIELLTNNPIKSQLRVPCKLYDSDEWKVKINYCTENDDNPQYYDTENDYINFSVYNRMPTVSNLNLGQHTIDNMIGIYNIETNTYFAYGGQYVLVLTHLYNGSNTLKFVSVSDTDGTYTLKRINDINNNEFLTPEEWMMYTQMTYKILPKHNLIESFKNLKNPTDEDIITAFTTCFNDYIYNEDENRKIIQLYHQSMNNDFVTLFYGYNERESTITLSANGDDNNGTE